MLFGGVRSMLDYKKSAQPDMAISLAALHFFTKEYLQRRYLGLTTKKLPHGSTLPEFRLFADEQDLASMDSNLPESGKGRYISGQIKVDSPSLTSEIQLRYRGGLPLHWLYDKKSFRVKLPPFTTYRGERQFNLVNPSTIHTVTDWVSYEMSRSLGLLTPDYFPARVNVNEVTNGLHFFLSRVDESFLRKNHRMPGSIYSGDTIYSPNPFGADKGGVREATFRDETGMPFMWSDERLWEKDASRNAESRSDRRDIQKFIEVINLDDPLAFMNDFDAYFDKEKFYLYWGLDTLVGSYHHDLFHNHKMYFDPYKGKFEPIEWDLRFWSAVFRSKDLPLYPLLRSVKLNPILEYERDQVTYGLMEKFSVADVEKRINDAASALYDELAADPLRHQPDSRFGRFVLNKEVPFFMDEFEDAIEELKLTYKKRHEFLSEVFGNTKVEYVLAESGQGDIILNISVDGNSPVDFDPWVLVPISKHPDVKINRLHQGETVSVNVNVIERLYPGRSIQKGNVLGRADNWANLAFGKERVVPSPLHYQYQIQGLSLSEVKLGEGIVVKNSITRSPIALNQVDKLASDLDTASVHPWGILKQAAVDEQVVLSGEINIAKDKVFTKNQVVKILPGTVFSMSKGSSLVFYGKVLAEGSKEAPIQFRQKTAGEPWGSIVIQGKNASGSRLNYILVNGGSVTRQRLIQYPGQINIHDVDSFLLSNCMISENYVGDDALHISYSKGEVSNCQFERTAFDALDIDIAEIAVADSTFSQIGNDALDLMTSKITISDVAIDGAGDKCLSVGEDSDVDIRHSHLQNCQIGIAVKDQSRAYVEDVIFAGHKEAAISLYRKNPRYSRGGTVNGTKLIGITPSDITSDEGSKNFITEEAFIPLSQTVETRTHIDVSTGAR
jgi:hypothetical protein